MLMGRAFVVQRRYTDGTWKTLMGPMSVDDSGAAWRQLTEENPDYRYRVVHIEVLKKIAEGIISDPGIID
jgi:hypothetical protein